MVVKRRATRPEYCACDSPNRPALPKTNVARNGDTARLETRATSGWRGGGFSVGPLAAFGGWDKQECLSRLVILPGSLTPGSKRRLSLPG